MLIGDRPLLSSVDECDRYAESGNSLLESACSPESKGNADSKNSAWLLASDAAKCECILVGVTKFGRDEGKGSLLKAIESVALKVLKSRSQGDGAGEKVSAKRVEQISALAFTAQSQSIILRENMGCRTDVDGGEMEGWCASGGLISAHSPQSGRMNKNERWNQSIRDCRSQLEQGSKVLSYVTGFVLRKQ